MIILEICKKPFDIIAITPRGTPGLCCVHIAQLMTHPAVCTLPFTLQLCYKPLGILQRINKSQKVHISSHDVLQKSNTCEEGGVHLRISFWHLLMNFEKSKKSEFLKKGKNIHIYIYWRYHYFTHVQQKPQSGTVPEIRSDTVFFVIQGHILPFTPPPPPPSSNTPQNQNFEKKKKVSGDVIILNLCNKKHNQMIYAYSDMVCARHKSPICPCRGFF